MVTVSLDEELGEAAPVRAGDFESDLQEMLDRLEAAYPGCAAHVSILAEQSIVPIASGCKAAFAPLSGARRGSPLSHAVLNRNEGMTIRDCHKDKRFGELRDGVRCFVTVPILDYHGMPVAWLSLTSTGEQGEHLLHTAALLTESADWLATALHIENCQVSLHRRRTISIGECAHRNVVECGSIADAHDLAAHDELRKMIAERGFKSIKAQQQRKVAKTGLAIANSLEDELTEQAESEALVDDLAQQLASLEAAISSLLHLAVSKVHQALNATTYVVSHAQDARIVATAGAHGSLLSRLSHEPAFLIARQPACQIFWKIESIPTKRTQPTLPWWVHTDDGAPLFDSGCCISFGVDLEYTLVSVFEGRQHPVSLAGECLTCKSRRSSADWRFHSTESTFLKQAVALLSSSLAQLAIASASQRQA